MASSGNFCTMNPLAKSPNATVTQGNLYLPSVGYPSNVLGTMAVSSGKWYFEARCENNYGAYDSFGVIVSDDYTYKDQIASSITGSINWTQLSEVRINGSNQGVTNTQYYNGDTKIVGCALDLDNNKVWFHGNGTYVYDNDESSANPNNNTGGYAIPSALQGKHFLPLMGTNAVGAPALRRANFGQDSSFGGDETAQGNADGNGFGDFYYTPPTGFLALCTANLPISDDIDPAQTDDDYPAKQFNTVLYNGNGSSTARTINGFNFSPDLIWVKSRSNTSNHMLVDNSRGGDKYMYSNTDSAELTSSNMITFGDSDGYVMRDDGTYLNYSSRTYVAWGWRANGGVTSSNTNGSITTTVQANTKAGFSIMTYTGTGSNATIGHGLSAKPDFILTKRRSSSQTWGVYHTSLGATQYLALNSGAKAGTDSAFWQDTEPTNTVISIGTEGRVNASSQTYVAYAWHNVSGYAHFGTYKGNGNADGPFIYTGFRPRMIFTKNASYDGTRRWVCTDTARSTFNVNDDIIWWDEDYAESANSARSRDVTSNGFKIRGIDSDHNTNGNTYVYGAWGDVPFKYNNSF